MKKLLIFSLLLVAVFLFLSPSTAIAREVSGCFVTIEGGEVACNEERFELTEQQITQFYGGGIDLNIHGGHGTFIGYPCEDTASCPQFRPEPDELQCCILYRGEEETLNGCVRDSFPKQCADLSARLQKLSGLKHRVRYDQPSNCTTNRECFAIFGDCPNPSDCAIKLNTGIPGLKDQLAPFNLGTSGKDNVLIGGFSVYLAAIYKYIVVVAVLLSVLVVMIGGYRWISAAGSPERIKEAQKMIGNAIAGLIIALISFTVLELLNKNLVELPHLMPIRTPRIDTENLLQGSPCKDISECGSGLVCLSFAGTYPICRKLQVGEDCGARDSDYCGPELFCSKQRTTKFLSRCTQKLGIGESCAGAERNDDDELACKSGICLHGNCVGPGQR